MKKQNFLVVPCLILGFCSLSLAQFLPPNSGRTLAPAPTSASSTAQSDAGFMQGLWAQPCQQGHLRTEAFNGPLVTLNEMFFADKECRNPIVVFTNDGAFRLPSAGLIDFRFTSVRIRLLTLAAVNDFNNRKVCGYSDWQQLMEKEISGRLCEIFFVGSPQKIPAVGDMRYGIYQIDRSQGRLAFGKLSKERNATTPDKRPLEMDPRPYLKVRRY